MPADAKIIPGHGPLSDVEGLKKFHRMLVETTAVVDATGAHPLPQRELPPEMLGLVQHAKAYERLAVKASCSGSRDDVVRALLANPLVGQYPLAAELADELLGANRHHLPRFFPS